MYETDSTRLSYATDQLQQFEINWASVDDDDDFPDDVQILIDGAAEPAHDLGDTAELPPTPEWIDYELIDIGQKLMIHYYSQMVSIMGSTVFLSVAIPGIFKVASLAAGKKPHLDKAFNVIRLFETMRFSLHWIFDCHNIPTRRGNAYNTLRMVRGMHIHLGKACNEPVEQKNLDDIEEKVKDEVIEGEEQSQLIWKAAQEDFRAQVKRRYVPPARPERTDALYMNQYEMAMTQFQLLAFVILCRDVVGIKGRKEMEAIIHCNRALGYYLGIKDKYNVARGSVEDVERRCREILFYVVGPQICSVPSTSSRLSILQLKHVLEFSFGGFLSSVVVTPNVFVLIFAWCLRLDTPRLWATATWIEKLMFYLEICRIKLCTHSRIMRYLDDVFIQFNLKYVLIKVDKLKKRLRKARRKDRNYEAIYCPCKK